MIEIIPAVDLIDGRCVRLTKGDYGQKKVYDASPEDMALRYFDCGVRRIHLVDLDGAKVGFPANLPVLEKIASKVDIDIEWGGGISSAEALGSVFDAGADYAIVGSVAAREPSLFSDWLSRFGAKVILGADVRGRDIAVKGWQEQSGITVSDLIGKFLPLGLENVICTDISRDGMLQGPSFELYSSLMEEFPGLKFTASGGISVMDDIRELDSRGVPAVIVGKAIYENRISLEDIKCWQRG